MSAPVLVVTGPSGVGKTTVGGAVASAFDPGVHLRLDDGMPWIVSGRVDPWLPEAARQNEVFGAAMAAAAMQFAAGGYAVVFDGHMFPEALTGPSGLAAWCDERGVVLHYAVLRADVATCLARATARGIGLPLDEEGLAQQHARFADLGPYDAHAVDASGSPGAVAAAVLAAFHTDRLRVRA